MIEQDPPPEGGAVAHAIYGRRDAAALRRLHELSLRLLKANSLETVLAEVLAAAIELTEADFGSVQLRDPVSGDLEIVAQRGLAVPFLERVRHLTPSDPYPPMHAALRGRRVVVEDIEQDPEYRSLVELTRLAGFRAAQATPLHGSTGEVLGVLSTVHREPHRGEERELEVLELYAQSAVLAIERVRAINAAKVSERRYATLFESLDQAFALLEIILNDDGRPIDYYVLEGNAAFERLTGVGKPGGRRVRELIPGIEEFWIEAYGRVALTQQPALLDQESPTLGRWYNVYAFPVDEPTSLRVAIFFRDISAARAAEARTRFLLRLDDETRALSEPDAIAAAATRLLARHLGADRAVYMNVDADQDGVTIVGEYSPRHPSVLGRYRFAEFGEGTRVGFREGRTFAFDDVGAIELTAEERDRYVTRQVRAMIQVPLHKDGKLRATVAVYHATPRAWREQDIELVQDVTNRLWEAIERARVTRELRASEARLQQLADRLPLITWECAADGSVLWFNRRLAELTGQEPTANLGWGWIAAFDERDLPAYRAGWEQAVCDGRPYAAEARVRGRDGECRWYLLRSEPVKDEQGRTLCWYGGATDINDLKRMQGALEQTQSQLVEADKRKDEFLATLAHELRNPLAPLHNALEILKLKGGATDPSLREMMHRQVHQLGRLVNDLLDASRITRGVVELRRERIRLGDVLATAAETSRPLIESRQHRLDIDSPPEILWLHADAVRLTQVFANLLNNAARYSPEPGTVRIRVRTEEGEAIVEIRDDGIGIEPQLLERVFELFAQGDRSSSPAQGGLGIGLYLSRSLTQMHGGRLSAHSEGPGRGSTFIVRLPLAAADDVGIATDRSPRTDSRTDGKGHSIVVVDDNIDAGHSLALLLESLGARVRVFEHAAAALDSLSREPAAIAFVDLGMPGMDGYSLARRIRATAAFEHMLLVAVTGWGQPEDRTRSRDAGFDRHLVKPAERVDLEQVLRSVRKQVAE